MKSGQAFAGRIKESKTFGRYLTSEEHTAVRVSGHYARSIVQAYQLRCNTWTSTTDDTPTTESDYLSAKQEYLCPRVRMQRVKRPFLRCPYTHCTHRLQLGLRISCNKSSRSAPHFHVRPNLSKHPRLNGSILLYSTTAVFEPYFISHPPIHRGHPRLAVLKTWPQNS